MQNGRQILPCLEFVGKTYRSHHRHWHPASQELERVGLQQAYHRVRTVDCQGFYTWTKFNAHASLTDGVYFPLIMNSSDGFTNLEFDRNSRNVLRIYFKIPFSTGKLRKKTARFSMVQIEINLWTRIVKQIAENIWWIHYLVQVSFNCIKNFQFLLSSSSSNRLHWISLSYKE